SRISKTWTFIHLRLQCYHTQLEQINIEKERNISRANKFLTASIRNIQLILAEKHVRLQKLNSIEDEINKKREEIKKDRQEIENLKRKLQTRRQTLQESHAHLSRQKTFIAKEFETTKERWHVVHKLLAESRKVLINEVISLFELKKIRDAQAQHNAVRENNDVVTEKGKFSTNEEDFEYTIGGLILLKKADFIMYPLEEINTAIGYVIHMLGLVTGYLGVQLPFTIYNKGSESYAKGSLPLEDESKYYNSKRKPLYLADRRHMEKFIIGMSMLNYNIAFLCHTQGIEIPFHQISHTLENLYLCCTAPNLGLCDHLAALNRLYDHSFSIKFDDVVRIMNSLLKPKVQKDNRLYYNNISDTTLYDYFEEEFEDDSSNMDGETWVICDTV
ncbi:10457_t:CDS:2, partial [Entrophospora sp. SA101]